MDKLLQEEIIAALETKFSTPKANQLFATLQAMVDDSLDNSDLDHFIDTITKED